MPVHHHAGERSALVRLPVALLLYACEPAVEAPDPREFRLAETVVRRVFEDRRGTLWLGTNGRGVARVTPGSTAVEYFSREQGFGGHAVRAIREDRDGNLWFGTSGGLTRFDGDSFRNYTTRDGLIDDDVWCLEIAQDGEMWVGTMGGTSRFDGRAFTTFDLPASEPDPDRGVSGARIVHDIFEDSRHRMWFGTGGGAWIYDGDSLRHLGEADGLADDSVNAILEDTDGDIWFATHYAGVCRWDGSTFTRYGTEDGIEGTEAWSLTLDRAGHVWFPIENSGVYRFDGRGFTNYHSADGLDCRAVQCIYEDRQGHLWFGGWMALFRFDGRSFTRHSG